MTFDEFCERQGVTKEEKRQALMFLVAMRMMALWGMWDESIGTD